MERKINYDDILFTGIYEKWPIGTMLMGKYSKKCTDKCYNTVYGNNNKLKLMAKAPRKVYVVDNGFLASNAFQTTENKGRLLENLVFLELLRRKNKVGDNLFYYHSRNDRETDFVVRENFNVKQLIQVCYDMTGKKTEKREVDSILECAGELKCDNLLIITWNQDGIIEKVGRTILVIPYYKWCRDYWHPSF